MRVYTYFNHVQEIKDPALLDVWAKSWRKYGWEPIILNKNDAHAADPAMYERFNRSPLLKSSPGNPVEYTKAAMFRWVAQTAIIEPSLHVDWDVMCNGYTPADVHPQAFPPVFLAGSTCPCAVYSNRDGYRFLASALETIPNMKEFKAADLLKDSCDQYAFSVMPPGWSTIDPKFPCRLYLEDKDWEHAPMIHFPTRLTPYPRSATIAKTGMFL